jgi:tripeptide aminopeptidase
MDAIQRIKDDTSIVHGDVKIAFTPDEEIGEGTKNFDIAKFGADYAYTVDGEREGVLNKETFSANAATIKVTGVDIHPGSAKDVMVNSMKVAGHILSKLPQDMSPEATSEYQPFIHPVGISGNVTSSTLKLILRDFETEGLDTQKKILENIIKEVQEKFPKSKIDLEIVENYRNMREVVESNPMVIDNLWEAATLAGVNPIWKPIRGGTDGSGLSAMGLPTPNIFTGGANFHSVKEWLSVESMNKSSDTVINLVKLWASKSLLN